MMNTDVKSGTTDWVSEMNKQMETLLTETVPAAVGNKTSEKRTFSVTAISELFERNIPELEFVLWPWLCLGDSVIVSAEKGCGKTFFTLEVAKAITQTGKAFGGHWTSPKLRRVLYLDGEMGWAAIRRRANLLKLNSELLFYMDNLEQEENVNLADEHWQNTVIQRLKEINADVLIIDNLITLYRPGRECPNSITYMYAMNDFIRRLRKEKITTIIIDHEGKRGGGPRGTSAKSDIINATISLKRPKWASHIDVAHFLVCFDKTREFFGEAAKSFLAILRNGEWEISELPDSSESKGKPESPSEKQKARAFHIFDNGGNVEQAIAAGVPKSSAYRYFKEWKDKKLAQDSSDGPSETEAECPESDLFAK